MSQSTHTINYTPDRSPLFGVEARKASPTVPQDDSTMNAPRHEPSGDPPQGAINVRQSLKVNIAAGALGMVWVAAVMGMPIPLFMEAVGAGGMVIGLVATLPLLALAALLPGVRLAETLPARKPYWATVTLLQRMIWFLPALMPFLLPAHPSLYPAILLGTLLVSSILAGASAAPWQSWMADLMPELKDGRIRRPRQSAVFLTNIAALALMGWILDQFAPTAPGAPVLYGFSIVFAIAAFFGVADVLVHLWVPEPPMRRQTNDTPWRELASQLLKDAGFRKTTLAFAAWYFSVGLVGTFQFIYMRRNLDFSYSMIAQIGMAAGLGAAVAGFLAGATMRRAGPRTLSMIFMSGGSLLVACAWFSLAQTTLPVALTGLELPQSYLILLPASLAGGALYTGVVLCQLQLTARATPPQGRAMAMAIHWAIVGLLGSLGPLVGGLVLNGVGDGPLGFSLPSGMPAGFIHILAALHVLFAVAVAVPILARTPQGESKPGAGTTPPWTFVANPMQAVRNVYGIHLLTSPPPRPNIEISAPIPARNREVRSVPDLVGQLDDPSVDVCEEAIAALGEIGGKEAVDALRTRLERAHCMFAPQLARALRRCADESCVPILVRRLGSHDRETIVECARTLGEIGDPRAVATLKDIFSNVLDDKVSIACAHALGLLDDYSAAPALIERALITANPPLKQSMAIATANLFGKRDAFYQLLAREAQSEGAAVETMQSILQRNLARSLRSNAACEQVLADVEKLRQMLAKKEWGECAGILEKLHDELWKAVEAKKLSTRKLEFSSKFIFGLRNRLDHREVVPDEVFLGLYLLIQSIPGMPIEESRKT